jgi:hypothetical protein
MFEDSEDDAIEFDVPDRHPQYTDILMPHIVRSVQDIFLQSLRDQKVEMMYVFINEEQIDAFIARMLAYWEKLEKYEICQEVLHLGKEFKERWKNFDQTGQTSGVMRISDIFGTTLT